MSPAVRLPDTIRRRLEAEGRLPSDARPRAGNTRSVEGARLSAGDRAPSEDRSDALAGQCRMVGLPWPVREHRFHAVRRWRFDLAWPEFRVAVEVDGGGWVEGHHSRGQGIEDDCEKLSEAAAMGWRVLRVTPRQVERGEALGWIERALLAGPPWD